MSSLAEELPNEINKVRGIQNQFREAKQMSEAIPGGNPIIVEPQIAMMEAAIQAGLNAMASGDIAEMLRAHAELKTWED